MLIKNLRLIGFGRFCNREISFRENLSVIYGPNEAGKTTVVDAIAGVFFGFRGRREDQKRALQRYAPWHDDGLYKAGVTVDDEELGPLYIERDFLSNKAVVYSLRGESASPAGLSDAELAGRCFGVANFHLFKSTMLIRQEEIALLAREEISAALSRKIVSSGQGAPLKDVFNALGKKYLELNRGLTRNTAHHGPIRKCLEEINRLEEGLRELDSLSDEHSNMIRQAEQLEDRVCALKTSLAEISPVLTHYRKYAELKRERDRCFDRQQDIQARLDRVRDMSRELRRIEDAIKSGERYAEYLTDSVRRRVDSLERELAALKERLIFNKKNTEHYTGLLEAMQRDLEQETGRGDILDGYRYSLEHLMEAERLSGQISALEREKEALIQDAGRQSSRPRPNMMLPAAGAAITLASAAGLTVGGKPGYALASLLFSVGLTVLVLGLVRNKPHRLHKAGRLLGAETERLDAALENYRKMLVKLTGGLGMDDFRIRVGAAEESRKKVFALKKQMSEIDLARFHREKAALEGEYAKTESELHRILAAVGASSTEAYRKLCGEHLERRKERAWLRESIRQVLDGHDEEDLKKELAVLGVKIHNLQAEMDALNYPVAEDEIDRLAREEKEKTAELDRLEKELIGLRAGLAKFEQYALQGMDRWTLENRLRSKRAELKALEIKKRGIAEAVRMLRDAVREAQAGLIPQVADRAGEILAAITGGRYARVALAIDTAGLTVRTESVGGVRVTDAGQLSGGTRDQVYLALRVAVAEFVAGGRKFPLIMDDPFVNFDTERLNMTIDLLRALSGERQVILLTKDPFYIRQCPEVAATLETWSEQF